MTDTDPAALWAKAHKKEFVENLVKAAKVEPQESPAAIFMAGLPGAGKTEITKNLIKNYNLKILRIDMDEIASKIPDYIPEEADKFRFAATILLSETFSYALKHHLDFIMDGTFGNKKAEENIARALKHGYNTKIVYVHQDPNLAWQFTRAREKIEHRSIKLEGFVETYFKLAENLRQIAKNRPEEVAFDIIYKTKDNKIGKCEEDVPPSRVDDFIRVEYNKDNLIESLLKGI